MTTPGPAEVTTTARQVSARGRLVRGVTWAMALCGCVLLGAGLWAAPATAAEPVAFSVQFPAMVPGETRTEMGAARLDRDAELVAIEWADRAGLLTAATARLAVTVCRGDVCVSESDIAATRMPAGELDVYVTVTLVDDAPQARSGTATGVLTFTDGGPGGLAATGGDSTLLAAWGTALVAAGALLRALHITRTRRAEARG